MPDPVPSSRAIRRSQTGGGRGRCSRHGRPRPGAAVPAVAAIGHDRDGRAGRAVIAPADPVTHRRGSAVEQRAAWRATWPRCSLLAGRAVPRRPRPRAASHPRSGSTSASMVAAHSPLAARTLVERHGFPDPGGQRCAGERRTSRAARSSVSSLESSSTTMTSVTVNAQRLRAGRAPSRPGSPGDRRRDARPDHHQGVVAPPPAGRAGPGPPDRQPAPRRRRWRSRGASCSPASWRLTISLMVGDHHRGCPRRRPGRAASRPPVGQPTRLTVDGPWVARPGTRRGTVGGRDRLGEAQAVAER